MMVEVGQIWADNDKRNSNRELRVDSIVTIGDKAYAMCSVRFNGHMTWWTKDGGAPVQRRIRIDRFKPNATGYRLVEPRPTAHGGPCPK